MNRTLPVIALLVCALTGCAGGDAAPDPDGAPGGIVPVSAVDPVDVLRKVPGCTIYPGVTTGEPDMNGNLYASCELPEVTTGEGDDQYVSTPSVLVRAVDPAAIESLGIEDAEVDDSTKVVHGDDFYLTVNAEPEAFVNGSIDMDAIAEAVGGDVVE